MGDEPLQRSSFLVLGYNKLCYWSCLQALLVTDHMHFHASSKNTQKSNHKLLLLPKRILTKTRPQTSQGAKMDQVFSSLWSSGCQGETGCSIMAFQEECQGFACHSWNSHAAAQGKQHLVNSDHDLWNQALSWLSWKECNRWKTFTVITSQRQRGQMQGCMYQKLALAVLA